MKVVRFKDSMLDACAEFWWETYRHRPYVHKPDGYDWTNGSCIGPHYFIKHLEAGLSNEHPEHWCGELSGNSIFIAQDNARMAGILISGIDAEQKEGTVIAAFTGSDKAGYGPAELLLNAALELFRSLNLETAVAARPYHTLELESPLYTVLRNEGFSWDQSRWPNAGFGLFLGGSIDGFTVTPEINGRIESLKKKRIDIRRCKPEEAWEHTYYDSGEKVTPSKGRPCPSDVRVMALKDDRVIGHAVASTATEWAEEPPNRRMWGESIPFVIPEFRGQGIGKVVYHLGVEWLVSEGAVHSLLATGLDNPAQYIYQSTPLQYWYTSVSGMSKRLQ